MEREYKVKVEFYGSDAFRGIEIFNPRANNIKIARDIVNLYIRQWDLNARIIDIEY